MQTLSLSLSPSVFLSLSLGSAALTTKHNKRGTQVQEEWHHFFTSFLTSRERERGQMGSHFFGVPNNVGTERCSPRKSKKSEKPKQPQRGLGVAQLEQIRLRSQMGCGLTPPYSALLQVLHRIVSIFNHYLLICRQKIKINSSLIFYLIHMIKTLLLYIIGCLLNTRINSFLDPRQWPDCLILV